MSIAVFFFLTWLICSIFVILRKKLTRIENTFLFLLLLVIHINFSWIVIEEIGLIQLSEDPVKYIVYLLNRTIVLPIILIAQLNSFLLKRDKDKHAIIIPIFSIGILVAITAVSLMYGIIEYKGWNLIYEAIYLTLLHVIAFYTYRFLERVTSSEVRYR